MENNIPKGIYCYDENGMCPYYEEVQKYFNDDEYEVRAYISY